ncbi:nucleotidyltransferase family protein [Pelistega sp. NLN82]|uniref:Nucleotidyltransferase family protein n=1 Tax=Pelistega ratti TaxID=2652177 RepID=A0A6L9Y5Z1_9BURK|nr:nucleotidyltransferase family protein [Pelistega ratti]NEN75347.1 nucleotidyltransferase family protein [Pelistega ratti]
MRPSDIFYANRDAIREMFLKNHPRLSNLRVVGSVARGEDTEDSDIDFLVLANPNASVFELGGLCSDLEEYFGDNFDLIEEQSIPEKFKLEILNEAIQV